MMRWPVLAMLAGLGCANAGSDRVLSVDLVGVVSGTVVFDANGNGVVDAADTTLSGTTVELVQVASQTVVLSRASDATGAFRFVDVPVGRYQFRVDTSTVGDTVVVASVSVDTFTLNPADTVTSTVRVRFPVVSSGEVRTSPVGRRVFIQGVAVSPLGVFGDTTVHVADSAGTIRVTRVRQAAIATGDSVRLLGRRNTRGGQPVLDDVTVFPLGIGIVPTAQTVTSAVAAGASGGSIDATLVSVLGAMVIDTATVGPDYHVTGDDGSGPVVIVVAPAIGLPTGNLLPDSLLDVTGVLVPTGGGDWELKPRVSTDVTVR